MSGDVSKLPKWAQREIASLERQVFEWKALALDGPGDTDTSVRSLMGEMKPLERGARVRFQVGRAVGRVRRRLRR